MANCPTKCPDNREVIGCWGCEYQEAKDPGSSNHTYICKECGFVTVIYYPVDDSCSSCGKAGLKRQ